VTEFSKQNQTKNQKIDMVMSKKIQLSEKMFCETKATKTYVKHNITGSGKLKMGKDSDLWIIENYLTEEIKSKLLQELEDHDHCFQRPPGAFGYPIPRGQCAFGTGVYKYGNLKITAVPAPTHLQMIIDQISNDSGIDEVKFVLVNKYSDGNDSVGLHADDEESLNVDDAIFSLSLGASRNFVIRTKACMIAKPKKNEKTNKIVYGPYNAQLSTLFTYDKIAFTKISLNIELKDNVMLVMSGKRFQQDFVHEVPKQKKAGCRYNLTFRSMK
jgi:alkylated DNA repair dioxygenase AlkB